MAIIPIVQWNNAPQNVFAWKFTGNELTTKSQLIVSESQEAIFVKEGQVVGVFGPGRHTLDTKNYPFLTKFITNLISGGETPFTAEIWFIQKAIPLNIKWGTADPIQIEDPQYHVMLPVRAFGQYGVQIADSQKFFGKMVGRLPAFTEKTLSDYFKGIIITRSKDCIAKYMVNRQTSLLHISSNLSEISDSLNVLLSDELDTYGLRILSFMVNSISVPENDPTVIKLREAMAKRAEMNIVGYTYQQERSFGVMDKAAANEGSGQVMNAGVGLGMGMGVGIPMGNAMAGMGQQVMQQISQESVVPKEKSCSKCRKKVNETMVFCPYCGSSMKEEDVHTEKNLITCSRCGTSVASGMKFCPGCGNRFNPCLECGADNAPEAEVCGKCGKTFPKKCSSCGTLVDAVMKFCPECGNRMIKLCSGCGKELVSGMKFCAECGTKAE